MTALVADLPGTHVYWYTSKTELDRIGGLMVAAAEALTDNQRWGATDAEVAARMPGDDLVPDCQFVCTRAITIDAPPQAVWQWLVQIGFGKAGYSNHLLDNAAHPSADQIIDELQHPQVGDWVPMFTKVNDVTAFKIAAIRPDESLLWVKPDGTWTWKLTAVGGRTRLVTRTRARYPWEKPGAALMSVVLMELGDFATLLKMLRGIKRRAEQHASSVLPRHEEAS
jgi:hypothetical protein